MIPTSTPSRKHTHLTQAYTHHFNTSIPHAHTLTRLEHLGLQTGLDDSTRERVSHRMRGGAMGGVSTGGGHLRYPL